MFNLYDIGYQDLKSSDQLHRIAETLNARVVDIRFSPGSKDPQWRADKLARTLGKAYHYEQRLGNRTYKTPRGNRPVINIADMAGGTNALLGLLKLSNVIIMCACWNRLTCHRYKVLRHINDTYKILCNNITKEKAAELAGPEPINETQLNLFEESQA